MGDICCSIPQISPAFPSTILSRKNPQSIPINSTGNLWKMPEESMRNFPSISVWILVFDGQPKFPQRGFPSTKYPRGFPLEFV